MPLDPLVKAFLDRAAAIPRPKDWDVPPVITRQSFAAMLGLTAPRDVAVEIDRYIAQPGQACAYKIGELTFARLRREPAAALEPKFDVRDFHEVCLDTGALPLAVLETKVRDWIAAGGGRPVQS